jgi:TPR repeat protein
MLGAAHILGAGVARDRVAALTWLIRARAGGSALADRYLKVARRGLAIEDSAEAERRSALPLGEIAS